MDQVSRFGFAGHRSSQGGEGEEKTLQSELRLIDATDSSLALTTIVMFQTLFLQYKT